MTLLSFIMFAFGLVCLIISILTFGKAEKSCRVKSAELQESEAAAVEAEVEAEAEYKPKYVYANCAVTEEDFELGEARAMRIVHKRLCSAIGYQILRKFPDKQMSKTEDGRRLYSVAFYVVPAKVVLEGKYEADLG